MMNKQLVSCIITTYNRPKNVLEKAVNSVLRQTYGRENIEVVIVNDAPENKALAIEIKTYCEKVGVKYVEHEKNKGACAARNTGINNSSGEIIGFLDDDDEWLEDKLSILVPYFDDSHIALVYGDYYLCNDGKRTIVKREYKGSKPMKDILLSNFIGSTSLPLLRRQAVIDAGLFDKNIRSSQDHDLWIRLIEQGEIAYSPNPIAIYNISEVSITSGKGNRVVGYNQLLSKYKTLYEKYTGTLHKRLLIIARTLARDGNIKDSKQFYFAAVRTSAFDSENILYLGSVVKYLLRRKK